MNWLLLEVSIVLILAVIIVVSTLPKKRKVPPPPLVEKLPTLQANSTSPSAISASTPHNGSDESKV